MKIIRLAWGHCGFIGRLRILEDFDMARRPHRYYSREGNPLQSIYRDDHLTRNGDIVTSFGQCGGRRRRCQSCSFFAVSLAPRVMMDVFGEQVPPSPGYFGEESRWIALLMSSLGETLLLDSSSLSSTWDLAGLGDR